MLYFYIGVFVWFPSFLQSFAQGKTNISDYILNCTDETINIGTQLLTVIRQKSKSLEGICMDQVINLLEWVLLRFS